MSNWQIVLLEPAKTVLAQVGQFFTRVLLVVVILIIGWVASKIVKTAIERALRALKIDTISDRIELDSILAKGGIKYSLSELIGVIFYWFGILVTFVVAINAAGLSIAAELLNKVVLYVPNILAAIFILILGMFVATLLRNIVRTAANNAGLAHSNIFSKVVEVIVAVFVITIALEQLGIDAAILQNAILIALSAIGLGVALAFGIGCKDIAGKFIADLVEKLKK